MDPRRVKKSNKSNLKALGRIFFYCVIGFVLGVGTIFYAWKWGFDFSVFERDSVSIRGEFVTGNNETVIKPIDWKARYYRKVHQFKQLSMELMQLKENIHPETDEADSMDIESKILLEENLMMITQIDYLEEELKKELGCNDTESRKTQNSTHDSRDPAKRNRFKSQQSRLVDSEEN